MKGALKHVDRGQLAMSLEESAALAQALGIRRLSQETLKSIHEKSQGWIAGTLLMQQSEDMAISEETPGVLDSNGTMFDFFAGEVLASVEPETHEFLLTICFLPEISVETARQLSGTSTAGKILSALYRKNLFLEKHGHPTPVYTFHALFRDFLQHQAEEKHAPPQLAAIKRSSARVLEHAGNFDSALALSASIGDWEHVVAIILEQAPVLMQQGRFKLLQQWIGRIPDDVVKEYPVLSMWLGSATLPEDPATARTHLVHAYSLYHTAGETGGCLTVWPAIVETIMYEWGDFHPLDQWINSLTALLGGQPQFPSARVEAQVVTGMFSALMFRQPDNPDLPVWEHRMEELVEGTTDPNLRIIIGSRLAQYGSMTGTFAKARQILDRLRPLVTGEGVSPLARITFHSVEAIHFWITGQPDACLESVSKGLRISSETGVAVSDFFLYSQGAYGALTKGDVRSAEEYLSHMESGLSPDRYLDQSLFYYLVSWASILKGDALRAEEEIGFALEHSTRSGMHFSEGIEHLAASQVAVHRGKHNKAKFHLEKARAIARSMRSEHMEFMCLLLTAYIGISVGDTPTAEGALRSALALGRKNSYVNFPWWQPSMMSVLAETALSAGIEPEYVQTLIKVQGLTPSSLAPPPRDWPWPVQVEMLGGMRLSVDGSLVKFGRKVKKKPLEFLKAIIALDSGAGVPWERVADLLWPESEGDASEKAFAITLHRLRELLGNSQLIRRIEGKLSVNPELCWVDAVAFERVLDIAQRLKKQGDTAGYYQSLESALSLYKGTFLPNDDDLPWAVPTRERLRSRFVDATCELGEHLMQLDGTEAVHRYQNSIAIDPLQEVLYCGLIRHHLKHDSYGEALSAYNRCKDVFASADLPLSPSGPLEILFQEISAPGRK
ncbi:MAG: hypothetical protein OEY97_03795 [Nitrospirota bacterium]|nr:hypothetical protein [Nitrospirota bacterium]